VDADGAGLPVAGLSAGELEIPFCEGAGVVSLGELDILSSVAAGVLSVGEADTPSCVDAGVVSAGELEVPSCVGAFVGGATHLVQMVDVMVLKMVETVDPVLMIWLPPEVAVCVTGHVVR